MQTSALIERVVNDRSFSKRRGSSFQDSISIVSFSLSTGQRRRSYGVSLFLSLYLSQSFIPVWILTSFPALCYADIDHNATQKKVILFVLLTCTY